jgi:putative flippase GtrA
MIALFHRLFHSMLHRMGRVILLRYLAASGMALAADIAAFLALLKLGAAAMPASIAGYAIGIAAHWLLSSRTVFTGNVAVDGAGRMRQKSLFVMSALVGLAITAGIVGLGSLLGADPRLCKLLAVGVSFMVTWLLREKIVFA